MEQVSWKKPLILAATLALGGLGVYWFEFKHRPEKEDAAGEAKKIFSIKGKTISTISLSDGTQTYRFRCIDSATQLCKPGDQSRWEMEEPSKQTADASNVNSLLSTLNSAQSSDSLDLKTETSEKRASLLKEYGLDSESRAHGKRIEIKLSDGKILAASFGAASPIDQSLYTLIESDSNKDGGTVLLSPSNLSSPFAQKLTYWRDKKVLILESSKLTGFELKGSKDQISGTRTDGKWTIFSKKNPAKIPGDLESIDSLISGATYLVAKEFPSKEVLKGAKSVLELTFKSPEARTLKVFETVTPSKNAKDQKSDKRAFATLSDSEVIYEIDPSATSKLDKNLKDLRLNRLISSAERFSIKQLEISGKPLGGETLLVGLDGSKWMAWEKSNSSKKHEADQEKVQILLDKLSGNRIEEYLSQGGAPQGENGGTEILFLNEKKETVKRFRFWTYNFKLYARDLASPEKRAFVVETSVSGSLPWTKDFFDKKEKKTETPQPLPSATR